MNFRIFEDNWIKYYKRTFLISLFIVSLLCIFDQTQNEPFFFFSKIDSFFMLFISATVIFFYSIAGGLLSIIYLILISLITKK